MHAHHVTSLGIAALECKVYREACDQADSMCQAAAPACSLLANESAVVDGVVCQPVTFNQPCDWLAQPETLGSQMAVLPQEPVDEDYPYACVSCRRHSPPSRGPVCAGSRPAGRRRHLEPPLP